MKRLEYQEETVERFTTYLMDAPFPMRFRLVLDGDWKSQVDAALGDC